jgi:hypothetical protein
MKTLQGAIEKSPILLSQYWKNEWMNGNIIISYFGGSNNICADCRSKTSFIPSLFIREYIFFYFNIYFCEYTFGEKVGKKYMKFKNMFSKFKNKISLNSL